MHYSYAIRYLALITAGLLLSIPAHADLGSKRRVCMTCHQVEGKLIGPPFKDVAVRYKGKTDSGDVLSAKILGGSKGVWGTQEMPPNKDVSAAEAKKLAAWILDL